VFGWFVVFFGFGSQLTPPHAAPSAQPRPLRPAAAAPTAPPACALHCSLFTVSVLLLPHRSLAQGLAACPPILAASLVLTLG
jgi:hypothetical protein